MKFMILIAILSSMLFSAQKQIILGSYSVDSNGVRAVGTVKKQIENDEKLQALMNKKSLRVISTKISGYTVVSVNALESYKELFRALSVFKKYYADAFVLAYPTQNIQDGESLAQVEQKAQAEIVEENVDMLETQIIEEEKLLAQEQERLEQERLEKERLDEIQAQKIEEQRQAQLEQERIEKERLLALEEQRLQEAQALEENAQLEDDMDMYYLYIALGLLLVSIIGFVVYSQMNKKEEDA